MNNTVTMEHARAIMGSNMIGPAELDAVGFIKKDAKVPSIRFSADELERKKADYLLVLGADKLVNEKPMTIRSLLKVFGNNPDVMEPCFYNQDWYENETFIDYRLKNEWFLMRTEVYENSRGVQPDELVKIHIFPRAITCAYTFFVAWQSLGIKLWYHDFVWCSDTDHNGDRIYVGKYHDIDGVNKNGFSIHRHLSLRPCYGCID